MAFVLKAVGSSWRVLNRGMMLTDQWALRAMSEGVKSPVRKDLRSVLSLVLGGITHALDSCAPGPILVAEAAEVSKPEPLPHGARTVVWGRQPANRQVVVLHGWIGGGGGDSVGRLDR